LKKRPLLPQSPSSAKLCVDLQEAEVIHSLKRKESFGYNILALDVIVKKDESAHSHNCGSVSCPPRCADTGRYWNICTQLLALP